MLITQALAGPGGGFLLPFSVDLPTESLTQEYWLGGSCLETHGETRVGIASVLLLGGGPHSTFDKTLVNLHCNFQHL